jgi:uncharacterized membrane-anchored protein
MVSIVARKGWIMASVSIHGLDDNILTLIKAHARNDGVSVNREVKKLLYRALGVKPPDSEARRKLFEEFRGVWSEEEHKEFNQAVKDFDRIDDGDWQ